MLSPYYEVLVNDENIEGNLQPLVHTSGNSRKKPTFVSKQQREANENYLIGKHNEQVNNDIFNDRTNSCFKLFSILSIFSFLGFVGIGAYRIHLTQMKQDEICTELCIMLLWIFPVAMIVFGCISYCISKIRKRG